MTRILAIAVTFFLATSAFADEDQVEYRQEVMSAVGSTMGAIGKILKQEVDRPDGIAPLAAAIAELAKTAQGVFPEGSEGGDAMAEIWENPEDFAERLTAFAEAASAFRDVAASGNMAEIGPAVGNLGQSCRGCHQKFRE